MSPASAGLPADGRRRTPGLRREELAALAGVGLSWYTWLEQGRDIRPSPQVLDALARALGLDGAEQAHLFHLARVEQPLPTGGEDDGAPAELRAFVENLLPHPAYLLGARTDVLAWNHAAAALLGRPGPAPDGRPNLLWWLWAEGNYERRGEQWRETARNALARFRAEHARRIGDPEFERLILDLGAESPAFREQWARHQVLTDQLGTKESVHPELGRLRLLHVQSAPISRPDLRLVCFVGADDATREALARLGTRTGADATRI